MALVPLGNYAVDMQRTSFSTMACSIARSLDVVGEPWTPLILRDLWLGRNKFEDIQRNLDISRKVLTERLKTLVEQGVVERRPYQRDPERYEYLLTDKGEELVSILLALMAWGDRWTTKDEGAPMLLRHTLCGKRTHAAVTCSCCGERLLIGDVKIAPGPGARHGWGTPWEKLPPRKPAAKPTTRSTVDAPVSAGRARRK
jgi:DNA-binding HxlR family transcriptional regulator